MKETCSNKQNSAPTFKREVVDLGDFQAVFFSGDVSKIGDDNLVSTGYDAILCLNGELHWEFLRKEFKQESGDFLLTPPGMFYRLVGGSDDAVAVRLRFSKRMEEIKYEGQDLGVYLVDCDILKSKFLELSHKISEISASKSQLKVIDLHKPAEELFKILAMFLASADKCIYELLLTKKPKNIDIIYATYTVLNDERYDYESISELAEMVGVSQSYFSRVFKQVYGITPGHYINVYKLNKSLDYLTSEKINLSGLSFDMGFTDQSHFTNTFKKFFSITPGELKRNQLH